MKIRDEIIALRFLGRMPSSNDDVDDEIIDQFEILLDSISKPVNRNEAEELVLLFPEEACYGMEWTLLHLIESYEEWPDKGIIEMCPSKEWKKTLSQRKR